MNNPLATPSSVIHPDRRVGGMTILTPSYSVSSSRYWWYMRIALNMVDGMSGKPSWMASTRANMSESLAVAMRTSFHVIDLMTVVAVDAQICVQRPGIGSSRERGASRISLGRRVVVCYVAGELQKQSPSLNLENTRKWLPAIDQFPFSQCVINCWR